jgi:hypothetical protein
MKKQINFLFILLITQLGNVKSQTQFPCSGSEYSNNSQVKEYFDLLFSKSFFNHDPDGNVDSYPAYAWSFMGNTYKLPDYPTPITEADCKSAFESLENGARLIESLLVMYETTHDKAYLHWAMDLSVHWISRERLGQENKSYSLRNPFASINHNCS